MLPMNMTTDDGPIFVNPKQYHGIIRRRKTRAKAVLLESKTTKKRKVCLIRLTTQSSHSAKTENSM